MRYASLAIIFVNTMLKSAAKLRHFSDIEKYYFPMLGKVSIFAVENMMK